MLSLIRKPKKANTINKNTYILPRELDPREKTMSLYGSKIEVLLNVMLFLGMLGKAIMRGKKRHPITQGVQVPRRNNVNQRRTFQKKGVMKSTVKKNDRVQFVSLGFNPHFPLLDTNHQKKVQFTPRFGARLNLKTEQKKVPKDERGISITQGTNQRPTKKRQFGRGGK